MNLALCNRPQASYQIEQGRLAAPTRPDNRHKFTILDGEVNRLQRQDRLICAL